MKSSRSSTATERTRVLLDAPAELTGAFSESLQIRLKRADRHAATEFLLDGQGHGVSSGRWPFVHAAYALDTGRERPPPESGILRLDPAHARPDINGIRVLAVGEMLGITADEHRELREALMAFLDERGLAFEWPVPERAYLHCGDEVFPGFSVPWEILGEDLLEHLPRGGNAAASVQQWRATVNDLQMLLHGHPVNVRRQGKGLPTVNLLWPWRNDAPVTGDIRRAAAWQLISPDAEWRAVWAFAGGEAYPRTGTGSGEVPPGACLIDLRDQKIASRIEREWLLPIDARTEGNFEIQLGQDVRRLQPLDRWKFWRR